MSDLQGELTITDSAITGTLKKVTTGALPAKWGEGYFIALEVDNIDADTVYTKAGILPSQGSGLQKLDPDGMFVAKVTDKTTQDITVIQYGRFNSLKQSWDLSRLTLQE